MRSAAGRPQQPVLAVGFLNELGRVWYTLWDLLCISKILAFHVVFCVEKHVSILEIQRELLQGHGEDGLLQPGAIAQSEDSWLST